MIKSIDEIKILASAKKTTLFIAKKKSELLEKHVDSNQVELFILRNLKGMSPNLIEQNPIISQTVTPYFNLLIRF